MPYFMIKKQRIRQYNKTFIDYFRNFILLLEKGQKFLTFILYDVLVLKEQPFKISGNTSNAGRVAGTLSFP